jgi:glycosyltransferase involved in cell wall biosynthesis
VDVVLVNFLFMLEYLEPAQCERLPIVLDQHECDELLWAGLRATPNPLRRWFASFNGENVKRFQADLLTRAHGLMCVSQVEADFMQERLSPSQMLRIVPNGVDTTFFQPTDRLAGSPTVLFVGSLNVARNIDAIRWFCEEMWAAVQRSVPGAELHIVGTHPTRAVRRLGRLPGVHVLGPVEDVRSQYEQAHVMIAPFRFGVGTRLKILEAMAMGVPIVATPAGCCGIDVVNEQHVVLASRVADFVAGVVRVLTDDVLAHTLREEARRLVEQRFEWGQIVADLADWMEALVRRRRSMTLSSVVPAESSSQASVRVVVR